MEQGEPDKVTAWLSVLLGVAAAFFTFSVPAGFWNYSAEGGSLFTGAAGGAVALVLGIVSRQRGESGLNTIGLLLGAAALAAGVAILVLGNYKVEFG